MIFGEVSETTSSSGRKRPAWAFSFALDEAWEPELLPLEPASMGSRYPQVSRCDGALDVVDGEGEDSFALCPGITANPVALWSVAGRPAEGV